MALSKRKARNITIDNIVYQYVVYVSKYDFDYETASMQITIQNKEVNGNRLFVKGLHTRSFYFDLGKEKNKEDYPIVTAKHIRAYIKQAEKEGFNALGRGEDFTLEIKP